jgi:hypothetical protein
MSLVYDQARIDIGAKFVGEEHAMLGTVIDLAVARVKEARFVQLSPLALAVLQSGVVANTKTALVLEFVRGRRRGPHNIGFYNGVNITVDEYAGDNIQVYGTNGEVETIELKNIRFI